MVDPADLSKSELQTPTCKAALWPEMLLGRRWCGSWQQVQHRTCAIPTPNSDPARPHYGPEVFAWTLRALSGVLKASPGPPRPRFGASSGRIWEKDLPLNETARDHTVTERSFETGYKSQDAENCFQAAPTLSYIHVFKTALCYDVVSGCFVPRVSPSSRFRPELAPIRGPAAPELAFRTLESARKIHAKSFGP